MELVSRALALIVFMAAIAFVGWLLGVFLGFVLLGMSFVVAVGG